MSKEIYISSTPHETRLAIVENDELAEIYYERENEYTLAGSIYNGKVTRVLPGMQSSFVDIGLERDAFLYITDFMEEEAGESADFESGGSSSRGQGREGARANDRRREDARTAGAPENGPAESEIARSAERESRLPERSDRTSADTGVDRGGDRRDRGRRRDDRSGNRDDRSGNRDRRPSVTSELPGLPPSSVFSPEGGSLDLTGDIAESSPMDASSLGEGALAADGSRRWRGRRGRRRGRGPGQTTGQDVAPEIGAKQDTYMEPTGFEPAGSLVNEPLSFDPGYNLSSPADAFDTTEAEAVGTFDIDAQADLRSALEADNSQSGKPLQTSGEASNGNSDRNRNRDRGDRGGRSRDGGRGGRGDRDRRAPRAPRGFAPSRSLYGVESTPTLDEVADIEPAGEPVILPGESLSKYRPASAADATVLAPTASVPKPSTEFILPGAWDGGDVLPGENLQRRSRGAAATQSAPRSESRFESRSQAPRPAPAQVAPPTPSIVADADGLSVAPVPSEVPELAAAADPSQVPAAEIEHEAAPQPEATAEYEPVEASAFLRFDPNPPSTYRQSAPPTDDANSLAVDDLEEHASQGTISAQPELSSAHTITPKPDIPLTPLHTENFEAPHNYTDLPEAEPPVELFPDHDSEGPRHEFTSINSGGEMLSEVPLPPPEGEFSEPSAPIQHETAVRATAQPTALTEGETASLSTESAETHRPSTSREDDLHSFAPGDGALEEEVLDDEEFESPTLLASAHEFAEYEQETLEGVADLGTMIRELSIDQITQPNEPGEMDDDEILEEEEAAHDGLYVQADELEDEDFASTDPSLSDDDVVPADLTDTSEASFGAVARGTEPATSAGNEPERRDHRRRDDSRRDFGRRGDNRGRDRGRSSGGFDRASGSPDRNPDRSPRPGRRDGRSSMQTTNLPAISDLLKPGQEVLVQIAKEPIAKKGARITSHIALPGRFLVFMPTVNHTGVSRKIESDGERRRLKEILLSEKGDASGGFIVRTAGAGATEEELRSDLRFLLNLWADIKQRSESSKSPALIYHDLNLVERILRDQVTDSFSAIWVDTETDYERILRFLQRFQPSLIRRVKLYSKDTPLFEQFGITEEINKALRSKVWLKSGGSIVINQTEALVAIDINTGKYVGKTARLEDTIVKTNLDAIPEIVRQIRLRDLGGIIIIDFIDMDERKNRNRVMAALEDELKKDRAPSKVLQFNDFGLVAITRKRVKQSLERTLSTTCTICQGTGMTKSPVTICNDIFVEMRKMQKHLDRGDVMLRVNPEVVKQLKSPGTRWLQEMEELVGKTILVKSDPTLHPEQFDIH